MELEIYLLSFEILILMIFFLLLLIRWYLQSFMFNFLFLTSVNIKLLHECSAHVSIYRSLVTYLDGPKKWHMQIIMNEL